MPAYFLATAVTAFVFVGGCQRSYRPEIAPVAEYRTHGDEAMERRNWSMTTAHYGNGNVVAGPTNSNREWRIGEVSDAAYGRRRGLAIVTEPLIALGTLVALPVSVAMDPPTEQRTYEGYLIEPTYTAAVPASEVMRETEAGRRQLARQSAARDPQRPEAPGEQSLPSQRQPAPAGAPSGTGAGGTGAGGGRS